MKPIWVTHLIISIEWFKDLMGLVATSLPQNHPINHFALVGHHICFGLLCVELGIKCQTHQLIIIFLWPLLFPYFFISFILITPHKWKNITFRIYHFLFLLNWIFQINHPDFSTFLL